MVRALPEGIGSAAAVLHRPGYAVHAGVQLELNGAYYCAPPWPHRARAPRSMGRATRAIDPQTKQLMREYRLQERGRYRSKRPRVDAPTDE